MLHHEGERHTVRGVGGEQTVGSSDNGIGSGSGNGIGSGAHGGERTRAVCARQTGRMDVATALGTYLEVVDSCAPGLVEGLYVVGSYALDDWHEGRSDIDIVAVTAEPATDDDAANLRTAHALLAEHQPSPYIDGPYVAWGDLITPAMGLHRPWVLDGVLHHDGDCFEINPITWYVLARHGITVRGPAAERLGTYIGVDAMTRFCVDNLIGYWRPLADDVRHVAETQPDQSFSADSFEWCALGALRLHHTAFQGGVVSKAGAGRYGLEVVPQRFRPMLATALAVRAGDDTTAGFGAAEMAAAADVISWCADDAERALHGK